MTVKHTANYINADSNFEITNIPTTHITGRNHQLICVLMNIFQRGLPTRPSEFLSGYIRRYPEWPIRLFSDEIPSWGNIIKGNEDTGDYPARHFYYDLLPKCFSDFPYIQQVMIPEVEIGDIVPCGKNAFVNQQVDFYVPDAKLVIEIDGAQHEDAFQAALDRKRDYFLKSRGVHTVRIPVSSVRNPDETFDIAMEAICNRIKEFRTVLAVDSASYKLFLDGGIDDIYSSVAIIRLQILFLELYECGWISFEDEEIKIAIKNHEVDGYEEAALEDLMMWIGNLSTLMGVPFKKPQIQILRVDEFDQELVGYIPIELSVSKTIYQIGNRTNTTVYVTNCCRQDKDYFYVRTASPIQYEISEDVEKQKALLFFLRNIFRHESFRDGQEKIIINALRRKDTVGVLPTGSGKSLCYQLAALLQPCISFCVSPIKSLMVDQYRNLLGLSITRVDYLSSDLSASERTEIQNRYAALRSLWIFVSPERFQDRMFREYLMELSSDPNTSFGYAIIDEVHCLSEWGHTFRVSYLNLIKSIRKYCPDVVLLGLTATASLKVLKNILIEFDMKDKESVVAATTFSRPELSFEVIKIPNGEKKRRLMDLLKSYRTIYEDIFVKTGEDAKCGIIFTPYVEGPFGCFSLSNDLANALDADVRCFSGKKPKQWKSSRGWEKYNKSVQEDFKENKYTLLCATKAFGMGIDKPNIRYTIHYGIPSSMEALYQEAGRAGRDGNKATCTVLYSPEEKLREQLEFCLGKKASTTMLREFVNINKKKFDIQADAFRQISLMSHEMIDVNNELWKVDEIIKNYYKPGEEVVVSAKDKDGFDEMQKLLFHLATIGAVDDWSVDWKSNSCQVLFSRCDSYKLCNLTERYIRNYDLEFTIDREKIVDEYNDLESIKNILQVFLEWYQDNILYSRRQALLNVMYACDLYSKDDKQAFKDNIEAYFQLNDLAELLGSIADEPHRYKLWFGVINADKIRYEKLSNILMSLNRYLESYRNNIGLNYISGILHMIDGSFDAEDGRTRLTQALKGIQKYDEDARQFILEETAKTIAKTMDKQGIAAFSSFFVENFKPSSKTVYTLCKILRDDYSTGIVLDSYAKLHKF